MFEAFLTPVLVTEFLIASICLIAELCPTEQRCLLATALEVALVPRVDHDNDLRLYLMTRLHRLLTWLYHHLLLRRVVLNRLPCRHFDIIARLFHSKIYFI